MNTLAFPKPIYYNTICTVQVVLQWSQAEIDLCINWGPVSYVIAGLFFSYILTIKGKPLT